MKSILKRLSHKNEKILRRELALAHSVIVLLSIGLATVLLAVGSQSDLFDQNLVSVACALLVVVALVSFTLTIVIASTKK
ncbi:MAG: hypothetical protein EOP04_26130 [Proteobacteria bacterium]|nr:MAG: hypothetical protein EOP04_26130 [Pseudomonadota bacterium]